MSEEPNDLEHELRRFQPAPPSEGLQRRLAAVLDHPTRSPAHTWWQRLGFNGPAAAIGWGLLSPAAAAAMAMIFAGQRTASEPLPSPVVLPVTQAANVLYQTVDEGVVMNGSQQPVRRVRYRSADQVRWHNPQSGAQWEVSYPREDVLLLPIQAE